MQVLAAALDQVQPDRLAERMGIARAAAETPAILTVEEHNVTGGLGSAVADVLVDLPRVRFRNWLAVSFGVMDGIWTISYAEYGLITDHYLHEAWRASVAYLRTYLPEELRPTGLAWR